MLHQNSSKERSISVHPIRFRSITERRLADVLMSREGKWDPDTKTYFTRERQLQERSRTFQSLHQTLRYSPEVAYQKQSQDLDFEYPKCPKGLLRSQNADHSKLSMEDPNPVNIQARAAQGEDNKRVQSKAWLLESVCLFDAKERQEFVKGLEKDLVETAQRSVTPAVPNSNYGVAGNMSTEGSLTFGTIRSKTPEVGQAVTGAARQQQPTSSSMDALNLSGASPSIFEVSPSTTGVRRGTESVTSRSTPLPRIAPDQESQHSSLLMQLRSAKKKLEQFHHENSTVQTILSMNMNASLRKTITRMFSDPSNADTISDEEHRLRELGFEEQKRQTSKYQADLLQEEKDVLEREMAQLRQQM